MEIAAFFVAKFQHRKP